MDLQQLHYFSVLAATQNFTRAASELHLTQSALSKSISAMEAETGYPLFIRTTKGAVLTECGKEFNRFCSMVLDAYTRCDQRMQEIQNLAKNAVNLVVTLPEIFVRVLEGFHREHPEIPVRLPTSDSVSAFEMLLMGQLDFAVNTAMTNDPRIEWVPLMRDEYLLMVPETMPYATGDIVDLRTFQEEPFIMPQSSSEGRREQEFFCQQAGFTPNVAFEVTENEMSRKLVQFGYGVAFVSSLSSMNTIAMPLDPEAYGIGKVSVKFLRIRSPECYRTIGINRIKNRNLSLSAELMYNYFLSFFDEIKNQLQDIIPPRNQLIGHSKID